MAEHVCIATHTKDAHGGGSGGRNSARYRITSHPLGIEATGSGNRNEKLGMNACRSSDGTLFSIRIHVSIGIRRRPPAPHKLPHLGSNGGSGSLSCMKEFNAKVSPMNLNLLSHHKYREHMNYLFFKLNFVLCACARVWVCVRYWCCCVFCLLMPAFYLHRSYYASLAVSHNCTCVRANKCNRANIFFSSSQPCSYSAY